LRFWIAWMKQLNWSVVTFVSLELKSRIMHMSMLCS